jgi:hypothetical protein
MTPENFGDIEYARNKYVNQSNYEREVCTIGMEEFGHDITVLGCLQFLQPVIDLGSPWDS